MDQRSQHKSTTTLNLLEEKVGSTHEQSGIRGPDPFCVVPIEHAIIPYYSTGEQTCPETFLEVEPTKPQCASSKTANSATSPRDQRDPPVRKVKVVSTKSTFVSIMGRKVCRNYTFVPRFTEEYQVRAGTSKERAESEMEVAPDPANSETSPRDQRKPPVRMVKVVSKKHRSVSKIWRKLSQNSAVFPRDTEEPQVQAGTSKQTPQSEMEVSPEPANSEASPRVQRKPPLRMVKVSSRKCMYGSHSLRQMCWRCPVVRKFSKQPEIQASAFIEGPQSEMEVYPEHSNSIASPVGQQNPQGRMEKMIYKKRRCVSAVLKEIYQKQHMVPLNEDKPQDITGTSREKPQVKTEVEHKNADMAPSPGEQREPPAMMAKVESRKHIRIPAFLRGSFWKKAVAPQGSPISEAPSAETTQKKMEEVPEHGDNVSSPKDQKTPVQAMKVECRKLTGNEEVVSIMKERRKRRRRYY
ncbi:uncharacterized protein LOC121133291 isoform X2 [Mesocricetus auratus]|uniref:Uncharacterized protein LOC121133291 isoform X2 n=1 Tax=Mesocricetus auratus TaxID=10036 RepID=A0ABM2W4I3_MESAU|nr:uncharacterized protein LOC121133291 isoform X2 [Mesocricetus auratus]